MTAKQQVAMSSSTEKLRTLTLVSMLILSVVAGTVALSGTAAAAANVSITPDDDDAGASGVTYTAEGTVEVDNQDTLQHIDIHLSPADVSNVGESDVSVFIDGNEYTDGLTQFSASGGTIEFKLSNSRSVSDGDPVRVVVAGVTNPSDDFDANVTLHDTGDAKWQTFADTVSIDTPPVISYSNLAFEDSRASGNDTTVDVGESLDISAVVSNSGEQAGTYNASLKIDGVVVAWNNGTVAGNSQQTITFTRSFDSAGAHNVGIETLGPTEVTVTGPAQVVDGSVDPSAVEPGTTVTNQQVFVDVADVSQDGDTDWHYVEFPNDLASSLSVNTVDANATSITSSPNLVDGFDTDGVDDTVKFATSGDGGGDIDLRLTADVDVNYPDTETTYGIDARVEDSDGGTDTQSDVAVISTESTPTISSFDATNPADRDVSVSFDANEQLADIAVDLTDSSGTTVTTLTEGNFTESGNGGTWTYQTTTTLAEDGDYDATLVTAADDAGNDGASGQTDTVTINTNSVTSASITPDDHNASASGVTYTAEGNVELSNQDTLQHIDIHLSPADVSNVGESDISVFIDGNEYTDGLSQFSASGGTVEFKLANSRSVSDGDPIKLVVAGVSNPSDDFDANVTLHDTGDAKWQTFTDTVTIDTAPAISYSDLSFDDGSASDDDTTVDVGESLDISAVVTNSGEQEGTYNAPLKIDGTVVAWNNGTVAGNSQQTITFTRSFDSEGAYDVGIKMLGPTEVTVTEPVQIVDGLADPDTVPPGTTVDNQEVTVDLSGVSADGNTDTHFVEFPNVLASGLSVNSASVNGSASIAQSAELVDGFDGDGVADTVRFQTDADGGGSTSLGVAVDVSVDYPDVEWTYDIDARIEDSDGDTDTQSAVATIEASDFDHSDVPELPRVGNVTAENPTGRSIAVAFNASDQLDTIEVMINDSSGQPVATLNESAFTATVHGDVIQYAATDTVESDGSYTVRLKRAAADDGSDVADGENETVTVSNPAAEIVDGSGSPATVRAGETVNNQQVSIALSGVSADGDTDVHYVEFPNALARNLSVNNADANATSITSSAELVDGFDDDGVADTVQFATSAENAAATDLSLTVDVAIAPYPSGNGSYEIDARTVDSLTGPVTRSAVATIEANASTETAAITDFELVAENRDVDAVVRVTDPIDTLSVEIDGPIGTTLDRSDFDRQQRDGEYIYTADVVEHVPGAYEASLEQVSDDGTDLDVGQSSVVEVPIPDRLVEFGATHVDAATEQAAIEFDRADSVDSVTVDSQASGSGIVTVRTFADAPPAVEDLSRPIVTVLNVSRPDSVADESVTLSIAVENSSFDANASALRMTRYDESSEEWVQLETTVANSTDGSVTVQASASETSMFAITEPADTDQQQAKQEPTNEDGGDGDNGSPGPLALLAGLFLLGIVGAGTITARRYYF